MNNIAKLLEKYKRPYVKGELRSSKTNKLNKRRQRLYEKHALCDELFHESKINLTPYQKEFIHHLIDHFEDFKKLHARTKNETIILSFIFYTKKIEDSRTDLNNYSISKKYGLTDKIFKLIICRMCDEFMKTTPLPYKQTTNYDHEILSRNGGKP
ncbi:MAG: hypothetical protein E7Z80_03650 [Methanobrevibacter thaueri]|nr:hypothetical protein [Methanobrevibacter thaueri]